MSLWRRPRGAHLTILAAFALHAQTFPYQNPDLPPDLRAADLVSRLTLAILSDWQLQYDDPLSDAGCGKFEAWN